MREARWLKHRRAEKRVNIWTLIFQFYMHRDLEPPSSVRSVSGEAHITSHRNNPEEDNLQQEPPPAAPLLLPARIVRLALHFRWLGTATLPRLLRPRTRPHVQVVRRDGQDIVIVRQLARFGGEAQICRLRQLQRPGLEALRPLVRVFGVLELHLQRGLLVVRQPYPLGRRVLVAA